MAGSTSIETHKGDAQGTREAGHRGERSDYRSIGMSSYDDDDDDDDRSYRIRSAAGRARSFEEDDDDRPMSRGAEARWGRSFDDDDDDDRPMRRQQAGR